MAQRDDRVAGAVLINAQSHLHGIDPDLSEHLRARTISHHSWRIAFKSSFRSKNMRKAIQGGQLDPRRILKHDDRRAAARDLPQQAARAARRLPTFDAAAELRKPSPSAGSSLFHFYSEGDEGLDYFQVVLGPELEAGGQRAGLALRGAPPAPTTSSRCAGARSALVESRARLGALLQLSSGGGDSAGPSARVRRRGHAGSIRP